jgi:hypothetical protein
MNTTTTPDQYFHIHRIYQTFFLIVHDLILASFFGLQEGAPGYTHKSCWLLASAEEAECGLKSGSETLNVAHIWSESSAVSSIRPSHFWQSTLAGS